MHGDGTMAPAYCYPAIIDTQHLTYLRRQLWNALSMDEVEKASLYADRILDLEYPHARSD